MTDNVSYQLFNSGVLCTFSGDIAYFDKDGDLFVTGRIKELIKHKGFQVRDLIS